MQKVLDSERNSSHINLQAANTRVESAERENDQALKERADVQTRESQVIDNLKEQLRSTQCLSDTQFQQMQSKQSLSQDQVSRNAEWMLQQKEAAMKQQYESRLSEDRRSKSIEAQERMDDLQRREQKEKKEIADQLRDD